MIILDVRGFISDGLCEYRNTMSSVAKNYDKRIEINRYRIPDLSDITSYTINIGFSHLYILWALLTAHPIKNLPKSLNLYGLYIYINNRY